jgi:O-antigen ligase
MEWLITLLLLFILLGSPAAQRFVLGSGCAVLLVAGLLLMMLAFCGLRMAEKRAGGDLRLPQGDSARYDSISTPEQ